jgi:uncharacterized membrane protein (UPF0127 family)
VRIITLRSPREKAIGLQFKPIIEDETLWVFRDVGAGDYFHSNNVPEPFDIAFVGRQREVILVALMVPPEDRIEVPEGAVMALESKAGNMARWGILPGVTVAISLV